MKKLLNKFSSEKGFTLIELLIVITIIAALAITVFVALDPAKRVKAANDARRTADADTILTAIHASIVDTNGTLPTGLSTSMAETQLGTGVSGCAISTGGCTSVAAACVDLCVPVSGACTTGSLAKYVKNMPVDILGGTTYTAAKTGYTVTVDANNIVTIKACGTQGTTNISVSR
ncbi:MAG: type II secretion system protein [Patescibacteria group bacterium]